MGPENDTQERESSELCERQNELIDRPFDPITSLCLTNRREPF